MNIIEAIKSDKPFYRKSWEDKTPITFSQIIKLSKEAMIADDWEVEEKPIPLTASLFDNKAELVLSRWKYSRFDDAPDAVRLAIADLRKELWKEIYYTDEEELVP